MNKLFIAIMTGAIIMLFHIKQCTAQFFPEKDKSRLYYMDEFSAHKGLIKQYTRETYHDIIQNDDGWFPKPDSKFNKSKMSFDRNGDITASSSHILDDSVRELFFTYTKIKENTYAVSHGGTPTGRIKVELVNDSTIETIQIDENGEVLSIGTSEFNQQLQRVSNDYTAYSGGDIIWESLQSYTYDKNGFAISEYYNNLQGEDIETITNTLLEVDEKGNTTKKLVTSDKYDAELVIYHYEYYDDK